jgi:hypothetical protein
MAGIYRPRHPASASLIFSLAASIRPIPWAASVRSLAMSAAVIRATRIDREFVAMGLSPGPHCVRRRKLLGWNKAAEKENP